MRDNDSPVGFTVEGIIGVAGGKAAVARACGVRIQSVAKWGRRVPARHAKTVAILAGLPLEIVRPDMVRSGAERSFNDLDCGGVYGGGLCGDVVHGLDAGGA